ncbi:MAG: hypothetical protein ACQEVA_13170 [Myxococcota bacterium]
MSTSLEASIAWLEQLRDFAQEERGDLKIPDGHMLAPLLTWQRKVTGGVLLQFLEFIQTEAPYEHFQNLEDRPIHERGMLFITDLPGAVAGYEIIQPDSDRALTILRDEWRAYLADPSNDEDTDYDRHYEFWSVWHQDIHSEWELDALDEGEYWIHEEGFALADQAGRGAQHLWAWDGDEMYKVQESLTSWVS